MRYELENWALRLEWGLGFGSWGWNFGFEAGIWASRLGFGPQGWDLGLKAGIWALRLGSESEGGVEEKKEEEKEKEKEEKIPHMCESIGHRPLWGRCPKLGR